MTCENQGVTKFKGKFMKVYIVQKALSCSQSVNRDGQAVHRIQAIEFGEHMKEEHCAKKRFPCNQATLRPAVRVSIEVSKFPH
jgi:hypothetical protein